MTITRSSGTIGPNQLRWVKTTRSRPGSEGLWHLSWDGAVTLCHQQHGYPVVMSLGDGPPADAPHCPECKSVIGKNLGLI